VTKDVGALALENRDAELVLAFVSPLGTPLDGVQRALSDGLREHDYGLEVLVRISDHLGEMQQAPRGERPAARQERLMDAGTDLRRDHGGDYLALMAIAHINATRSLGDKNEVLPHLRRAHLIRSLKHPDEVTRLRHVYGKGFFLLGVSAPRSLRRDTLIHRNFPLDEVNRLLDKDAAEDEKIGQQTRETFQLADAYLWVDGDDGQRIEQQVRRILDLLFSCPFHPPTPEEHAMFMAYAAALRSSDLSRQVGAVVTNRFGDVVASGANEAPAPHGGTYWPPRIETADRSAARRKGRTARGRNGNPARGRSRASLWTPDPISSVRTPLRNTMDGTNQAMGTSHRRSHRRRSTLMTTTKPSSQPITLTLREVLEGAKRAEDRVSKWPEWKQKLSPLTWPESGPNTGSKIEETG
jgi:deoxycytidylate deaminase